MLVKKPPVQIVGKLWMLGTDEYPIFVYRGETGVTLFEGGIGPSGPLLEQQLAELGIASESIVQLVVTHAHPDHVMAVPRIRELCPGVKVLASEAASQTLGAEKAISFFCKMDDGLTGALSAAGLIDAEHKRPPMTDKLIPIDRVLNDGDVVQVDDGIEYCVMATPGHSECSLSFHEPKDNVLIISDATGYYLPDASWWWPNYFTNYGAYLASIERLAEVGAEVVCLSHNAVIRGKEDVAAYFEGAIASTKAFHERIINETRSGKSVREIAETLGAEVHEKSPLMPVDFFQKNCGLLAKLSLRHEGMEAAS